MHIHGWVKALSSSVVYTSTKSGFKTVITLHDYFTICPNGGLYNYKSGCICEISKYSPKCLICNCDKRNYLQKVWRCLHQTVQDRVARGNRKLHYITVSEKEKGKIMPFVCSRECNLVTNPVQLSDNHVKKIEDIFTFLFVGRLSEEKGIEIYCKAMRRVKSRNNNVSGVIVGDGPLFKELSEKYDDLDFLGWQSPKNVQRETANSRALVFPSKWYEAAPLIYSRSSFLWLAMYCF